MLMPLNSVTEVKEINNKQQEEFKVATAQWIRSGKKGSKPSKKKPSSLLLGCFCCTQNCLNRPSGMRCVTCKEDGGPTTIEDPEYGDKLCACPSCLCDCKIVFPLEKRQEVAMETAAKLQGVSIERDSLKPPEQQKDIFVSIIENYTKESVNAVVKQDGSYSAAGVNHGIGLAGWQQSTIPNLDI
jgi:hypothetical protein